MDNTIGSRVKRAWNAFFSRDPTPRFEGYGGVSYRPDRLRLGRGNDRGIVTAIYNRIAQDAASIDIYHVKTDENGRYMETVKSGLTKCLSISANLDQAARAFRQDIFMSMMDEGVVAVIPIETEDAPENNMPGTDILSMRTGKITGWYPDKVRMLVYNERSGKREEIVLPKTMVAIVENPFYSVMNEPNSIGQRLARKLNLLDMVDENNNSGKLDLIIQLPYVVKSGKRQDQAEARRHAIEEQLNGSKYGIAYADGTERIVQLNRPVENNLMSRVEYLTSMLYSQLGITQEIMNGTADEKTMLNYYNRTVEPFVAAAVEEFRRKFLTKDARTEGYSVMYFRDPFKLVPVTDVAEIADKMTRNEIMTSNEIRQVIGMKPSKDPKADELRNSNMPIQDDPEPNPPPDEQSQGGNSK